MKAVTGVVVLLVVAASVTSSAQWLKHQTAGVPRLADGAPNLAAPAPRTADGKPDLSGMWDIEHNRPCPAIGCADMEVGQEFVNIGWSLKNGLPYQPWAADIRKKRMEENGKDDPGSHCLPPGIVKEHTSPLFRKIIQTAGLIVILYERDDAHRQIFTDGRPLPEIEMPTFNGYSVGRWEGDTLVVQSAGFKDGMWLDRSGSPMTEAARITERFRRVNYGKLEIDITVDDAKAYTAPWTVKLTHSLKPDTELLSYICMENEKSIAHMVGK
ncbi:MAG TPA: hypothetical protein VKE96_31870 [Vicinamibacterales bacterium]|nr:hypothetical protein [Vicinamibacterales bacterium]